MPYKTRTTKTTTGLPGSFVEAEEAEIEQVVREWRAAREPLLTAEASNEWYVKFYLEQLRDDGPFSACVVDYARRGHGAADRAVRMFAHEATKYDQWHRLPLAVRAYADECTWPGRPPLPLVYPARAPQLVNDLFRNMLLCMVIPKVPKHWPAVPLLTSTNRRRSSAALCGGVFGVSERSARRIFAADKELAWQLVKFLETYRADEYGPAGLAQLTAKRTRSV